MSVLLLAMMLPFVAIMIPLFKMMSHWGLSTAGRRSCCVHLDTVYDHAVPAGIAFLPQ